MNNYSVIKFWYYQFISKIFIAKIGAKHFSPVLLLAAHYILSSWEKLNIVQISHLWRPTEPVPTLMLLKLLSELNLNSTPHNWTCLTWEQHTHHPATVISVSWSYGNSPSALSCHLHTPGLTHKKSTTLHSCLCSIVFLHTKVEQAPYSCGGIVVMSPSG